MLQQLSQIQQIQQQNSGGIELQHHFTGAIVIVVAAVPSSSNGSNEADRSTAAPIMDPPANQEIPYAAHSSIVAHVLNLPATAYATSLALTSVVAPGVIAPMHDLQQHLQ